MMNIVLITDENYVIPTGTAIASILDSNSGEPVHFYIVTKYLSDSQVAKLAEFIEPHKDNASLEVLKIDEKDLIDFPLRKNDHVSVATYYRLYFPKIIPQNVNKILFLDGDILCVDSLQDFYNTDLAEYSCAVTHDERNDEPSNYARLKYPKENGYFCAGVMLINLAWWREHNVMQRCLDYIAAEPEACLWHDQDALNHVLNGTVLWASFRYNFMQGFFFDKKAMCIDSSYYPEIDRARLNPCILHFSSAYKPWFYECNHPLKRQYRDFYRRYTGKALSLSHKLHGCKRLAWLVKKLLNSMHLRHFEDFRKPVAEWTEKYQLFEQYPDQKIAGSKAPDDIRYFAEQIGFRTFYFFYWGNRNIFHRVTGQVRRFFEYLLFFFKIKKNSVILLQFPYIRGGLIGRTCFLKFVHKLKNCRIITLIHDINELRYDVAESEKLFLDYAIRFSDMIVTHNENMSYYLENVRKVDASKLLPIGLFDYHAPAPSRSSDLRIERTITIAGNLDQNKCRYLRKLPELKEMTFHLYGMNFRKSGSTGNIVYHGAFEPEKIIQELCHGFGLVWDGGSGDTCNGLYGKYLMYNNPHKLSMYVTAGLPLIVWDKSALCDFVLSNKIGIAVQSLKDAVQRVRSVSEDDYMQMHKNCLAFSSKLRMGFYFKTAMAKCLEKLVVNPIQ